MLSREPRIMTFEAGSARLAWLKLSNKYASKTPATIGDPEEKFGSRKLKKGEDPDEWITDLEELQARLRMQNDFRHIE